MTNAKHGPFVVLVTEEGEALRDAQVIGGPNGFLSKSACRRFIDEYSIAKRPQAGKGLRFTILPLRTEQSFHRYCSWMD